MESISSANWETIRAEKFCASVTDGTHDSPKAQKQGRKLITSKHLKEYYIDFESANWISESDYQKVISRSNVEQWDILYSMIGTVGNCYLERNPTVDYACKNVGIFKFGGNADNAYWMYYYLKSPVAQAHIRSHMRGSTQAYIPLCELRNMPVLLPPKEIRDKIISLLRALDDKIALNARINDNLEQMAKALFTAWFDNFEPFGGLMPDGWRIYNLESLCSLINKGVTTKYADRSSQIVINQKCVRNHQIDLSLARCHIPKAINEKWLQYGDIIVNSTGTGTLGRAAQVLFLPENLTVDSHITIIRPLKPEYQFYLGLWAILREHDFEALATGSTGQTDLPRERLKKMSVLLPDDEVLVRFSSVVKPIFDIMVKSQQENQTLSQIRDALLPRLMSGELDVSKLPLAEERISW